MKISDMAYNTERAQYRMVVMKSGDNQAVVPAIVMHTPILHHWTRSLVLAEQCARKWAE